MDSDDKEEIPGAEIEPAEEERAYQQNGLVSRRDIRGRVGKGPGKRGQVGDEHRQEGCPGYASLLVPAVSIEEQVELNQQKPPKGQLFQGGIAQRSQELSGQIPSRPILEVTVQQHRSIRYDPWYYAEHLRSAPDHRDDSNASTEVIAIKPEVVKPDSSDWEYQEQHDDDGQEAKQEVGANDAPSRGLHDFQWFEAYQFVGNPIAVAGDQERWNGERKGVRPAVALEHDQLVTRAWRCAFILSRAARAAVAITSPASAPAPSLAGAANWASTSDAVSILGFLS
jgi:hypothetical protein